MSRDCLGFDIFRDNGMRKGNFAWTTIGGLLAANHLCLVGFPQTACLPAEMSGSKASGGWRKVDLEVLNEALDARETGWGIRLEKHQYSKGERALAATPSLI
jgi:hypothetical protein